MRTSRASLAVLFLLSSAIGGAQEQNTEKAERNSLSETENKINTIHIEKDYPNPF